MSTPNPSIATRSPIRHEIVAAARLAAPVSAAHVGQMLMNFVDVMMLGRVSELDLAAGALGNSMMFAFTIFPMGVLFAMDPLVAQAWGAGDRERVARHVQRGLVLAAALSVPLTALLWSTEWIMRLTHQTPEMIDPAAAYVRWVGVSSLPLLLFIALRQGLQARSLVKPALVAAVVGNLVNFLANYALIFGHFGFPALGVVGSAYSTSISRVVMLITLGLVAWRHLRQDFVRVSDVWAWRGYKQILGLGLPVGWQTSLELWLFSAVALMMGHLGTRELAAHQIALNLAAMAFMVPLGVAGAAATRVGNAIGRNDQPGAKLSALVCLGLGAGVMTLSATGFYLAPEFLSRLYTNEAPVIALAVTLIPVAALFQVVDGLQVVGMGVLRGTADTRFPALIALFGYWGIGLPCAWFLAFHTSLGPRGTWLGLTAGLASVAVMLLLRIRWRFSQRLVAVE